MKPTISEFQYAYGVNRELEMDKWRYSLLTPPRIPTQNVESRVGYDMDTEIETGTGAEPLFIQYKRSEYMVGNARYSSHFPSSYYRFKITNADQHNTLVLTSQYYPHTYYVAPLFYKNEEYFEYHKERAIIENSNFTACEGLERMDENDDSDKHTIGFTENRTRFFSEPNDVESHIGISDILDRIAQSERSFTQFRELQESFLQLNTEIGEKLGLQLEVGEDDLSPFDWIQKQQRQFMSIGISLCFAFDMPDDLLVIYWKE